MKLLILGAPGAGKGTQAKVLAEKYNILHISTGDLLRAEVQEKTELGLKIADDMKMGKYISDEIVTTLLKNKLNSKECENGFLLDGYPRTTAQAKTLSEIAPDIDAVIVISVDDEIILERMSGRIVCADCGQVYHKLNKPPKIAGVCDVCGGLVVQRTDDKYEVVKKRLDIYHNETAPIINYYKSQDLVIRVSGLGYIDDITNKIVDAISKKSASK